MRPFQALANAMGWRVFTDFEIHQFGYKTGGAGTLLVEYLQYVTKRLQDIKNRKIGFIEHFQEINRKV